MADKHSKSVSQTDRNSAKDSVRVADVAKFLSRCATLHENAKTGNLIFADELRRFAKSLGPCARLTMDEFSNLLKTSGKRGKTSAQHRVAVLPDNLQALKSREIEEILRNPDYTKAQLAELGERRFGISRAQLARSSRADAEERIAAAIEHERSLNIIAQEAHRVGTIRSA